MISGMLLANMAWDKRNHTQTVKQYWERAAKSYAAKQISRSPNEAVADLEGEVIGVMTPPSNNF